MLPRDENTTRRTFVCRVNDSMRKLVGWAYHVNVAKRLGDVTEKAIDVQLGFPMYFLWRVAESMS